MSLRDLVTGNDACTPDDGAGPSNAFAGLANSLLGSSSQKQQERLSEVRHSLSFFLHLHLAGLTFFPLNIVHGYVYCTN